MIGYDLRSHTADVAIEATGPTLAEAFGAVAAGLTESHCETVPADVGERFSLSVAAESREALLFEYLDELIYQRDVRAVLPADHEVRIDHNDGIDRDAEWRLEATARGVPLDVIAAREIKAVTYSEMALDEIETESGSGWRVYVVFDV